MTPIEAVLVVLAGVGAGTINAVVGSGSLVTFPTLLAIGLDPLVANVSNNLGVLPGGASAVVGYRRELRGNWGLVGRLAGASAVGAAIGAVLLLALPESVFDGVVPVLVLVAVVLVIVQPRLQARLVARRARRSAAGRAPVDGTPGAGGPALLGGVLLTGVYGGYFGAAQGVLLLALLGIFLTDPLPRLNGVKNALAMTANGVAAVVFVFVAEVDWPSVGLVAIGAIVGGQIGSRFGRRLSPAALRVVVVVVGLAAVARLVT